MNYAINRVAFLALAMSICAAVSALATEAPPAAVQIDWFGLLASFWHAIAPSISLPLLLAYGTTWLAAFLKQATPESSPTWQFVRWVIDLVAANVGNAANKPKS